MISIIIPVYNVENYIDTCLQSIVNQTYTDWECLLIDDGSTDGSEVICEEWAARDKRFHVVHQSNSGVSASRNHGLRLAKGDFVVFVDSDDYVDDTYLSNLFHPAYDYVISGLTKEYCDGRKGDFVPSQNNAFDLTASHGECMVELLEKCLLYGPTNKLYRNSIIKGNGILFPENCAYGEDLLFNFSYLQHISEIKTVNVADYHYRIIGSGTLSTAIRKNAFCEDYEQWCFMRERLLDKGLWESLIQEYMYKRLWGIVYDGLFAKNTDAKLILSIPEIPPLRKFSYLFECSYWIKFCIVNKLYFVFRWV